MTQHFRNYLKKIVAALEGEAAMFEKKNLPLIAIFSVVACLAAGLCLFIGWGIWNTYRQQANPAGEPSNQPIIGLPGIQTPDPRPVGFFEGLASLNSYRLKMRTLSTGPTAQDYMEIVTTTSYNQNGDQSYTKVESTRSSAEEPTKKTSVNEEYRLGQKYCQRSPSDGETNSSVSNTTSMQQTMTDVLFGLFDMTIVTKDAKFAGAETVNGIPSNHFTFTVSGLGTSGAEVTKSQGEYWVAQDGQYLLKYQVTMEIRSGPSGDANAQVSHIEIQTEVSDINTAITVQMPPDCNK
jgi:hypothetical protein